jgi:hypothetical protein
MLRLCSGSSDPETKTERKNQPGARAPIRLLILSTEPLKPMKSATSGAGGVEMLT